MKALLIDFGATRIKSCLFDFSKPEPNLSSLFFETEGSAKEGKIVAVSFFVASLKQHLDYYNSNNSKPDYILTCFEMHGFVVDYGSRPVFISWRHSEPSQPLAAHVTDDLESITGMKMRSGLPVLNLLKLNITVGTVSLLPNSICQASGSDFGVCHSTLAHSTGFYNKKNQLHKYSSEHIRVRSSDEACPLIGTFAHDGQSYQLYGGFGDLQTTIRGFNPQQKNIYLNIGTGSQVIRLTADDKEPQFEFRPYWDNYSLDVISHLPAGRALNFYKVLYDGFNQAEQSDFWNMLSQQKRTDGAIINFDLAIFESAYKANEFGGSISGLRENYYTKDNFLCGLFSAFVDQYASVLNEFNGEGVPVEVIGTIPKKLRNFCSGLEELIAVPVSLLDGDNEGSLKGLEYLAKEFERSANQSGYDK